MTQKLHTILVDPVEPGKRLPFYRWIPNHYRGGRRHGFTRREAIHCAIRDWWASR